MAILLVTSASATYANPTLEKYFNGEQNGTANSQLMSVDKFVRVLADQCELDLGESFKRYCYSTTVDELSVFLKNTLHDVFEKMKSDQREFSFDKKMFEKSIARKKAIQHAFDKYYDLSCSDDNLFPYGGGSGSYGVISLCQMRLLIERINVIKSQG